MGISRMMVIIRGLPWRLAHRTLLRPALGAAFHVLPRDRTCASSPIRGAQSSSGGQRPYSVDDVSNWMMSELAVDVTVLDVREVMDRAAGDFLVFATARSHAHMRRLAKTVVYELKERRTIVWNNTGPVIEGADSEDWMLVDGGSVVVNIMLQEARTRLGLVEHWKQMGALVYHHEEMATASAMFDPVAALSAARQPLPGGSAERMAVPETDPVYLEDGDDFDFEEAEGEGFDYDGEEHDICDGREGYNDGNGRTRDDDRRTSGAAKISSEHNAAG